MSVNDKLRTIADAIREKTGNADKLTLDKMAGEIRDIGIGDENMVGVWLINEDPNITNESDFDVSVKGMFHYFDGTDFKELDLSRLRLTFNDDYGDGDFLMYGADGKYTGYYTYGNGTWESGWNNVPADTTLLRTLTLTEEPISPYLRNWLAANAVKIHEADYYNQFWDVYQANGERNDYYGAFQTEYWTYEIFRPKYDIRGTNFNSCFVNNRMQIDLVSHLDGLGVALDTSEATNLNSMFNGCSFTHVGVIDARSCNELRYTFAAMQSCHTIDKIILREDGLNLLSGTFDASAKLENLDIEGAICNSIDLHWSTKLSRNSIVSILNSADESIFVEGGVPHFTVTLPLVAVNKAFETSEGANDGSESDFWLSWINNTSGYYTTALI